MPNNEGTSNRSGSSRPTRTDRTSGDALSPRKATEAKDASLTGDTDVSSNGSLHAPQSTSERNDPSDGTSGRAASDESSSNGSSAANDGTGDEPNTENTTVIRRTPGRDDSENSSEPQTTDATSSDVTSTDNPPTALDGTGRDALSSFDLASDKAVETARLEALYRYNILDTETEQAFDHVAQMASYLFDAPFAAVSLIDRDRHWFKSCIGLDASELSLENSLCARAIQSPGVTVIEDTTEAEEFACMDVVEQAPNIRFYAGAPMTTSDGYHVGTLCVLDTSPRERPDEERLRHLENLANIVVDEMELRLETTRRKKQAQSLRQTAQRAEIARASAENARKRAEEAQRRAEEASSSKSRFLTGMAHDIRSPISAIDGFAQLLLRTSDGPAKEHADRILQATAHLRDMADTLSELAELESGSIDLDVEEVDLCPIIQQAVSALEARADTAEISLEASTPTSPVFASANAQALRRVIDNLAGNAIKYCECGDRVSVRLHAPSHAAADVCIEISDTGPGIDGDFLDIMFEPFTQRDENSEGSGLGLAVTKELVQAMNGRVEASSSAGEGTTFRVILPGSPENGLSSHDQRSEPGDPDRMSPDRASPEAPDAS